MTREFIDFVQAHQDEDTARLLLSAARYPGIDMAAAVNQIEGLRMAREKWPLLAECREYRYPPRLNREQASSEATARYKASVLNTEHYTLNTICDLTGGMGVDTMALAQVATHVDYVEQDAGLCTLMEHNCRALGISNITVHCADSMEWLRQLNIQNSEFRIVYIDPARRDSHGRKVAAFEDCTPDILQHLDRLRSKASRLLVKASPMIDLHRATEQLGTVSEVHIVAVKGECKEVLFLCDSAHDGETVMHCIDLKDFKGPNVFSFTRAEEQAAEAVYSDRVEHYLYDPHAALRKGGCFRLLGQRYGLPLLGPNTHLYTSPTPVPDFPGRGFEVLQEVTLDRKAVKRVLPDGKAHVVVRNFPTEAAALQRQLGLREGGDCFLVAAPVGGKLRGLLCRLLKSAK